jgi:tetrahydromethanopterin S-methyltransferase subunit C
MMQQLHGVWVLYFFCEMETEICQSSLLALCCSFITVVATSVILLLAMQMLSLFSSVRVWKVVFSHFMPLWQQSVEA